MTKGEIKQLRAVADPLAQLTTDGINVFQNGGVKPIIEVIREYNALRTDLYIIIDEAESTKP